MLVYWLVIHGASVGLGNRNLALTRSEIPSAKTDLPSLISYDRSRFQVELLLSKRGVGH